MIHKQLAAFERLLLHAMSRFSKENLYHMLRHVMRWVQDDSSKNSQLTDNDNYRSTFKLKSVLQLKECVTLMRGKRTHRSVEDDHVFKYYDLFLNDLLYLKDLKKYFDDEIYKSLMKYHYEPSIGKNKGQGGSNQNKSPSITPRKGRYITVGTDEEDSGHGSQTESNDTQRSPRTLNIRNKGKSTRNKDNTGSAAPDAEKSYRETVCELQDILKKWDGLLSEGSLNLNDFDPDSYHELMQFTNYSQFEPVLRLVPDIFAKCYKCIDLAKVWLKESNIVLKDIPLNQAPDSSKEKTELEEQTNSEDQSTAREFVTQIRDIKSQLSDIEQSIEDDERKLDDYTREMSRLTDRDDRFSKLTSEFGKMDSVLTLAAANYQKSKVEQYAAASKLRVCPRDSYDYSSLKEKLRKLDKEVSENHWKLKLLEFEKATVQEDYLVEIGVRPSFIRFIDDTKGKMSELQEGVQVKKEEKLKLGKQLALMKTNTEQMRTIMRTHLGSAETRARPSVDRESTLSSHPSVEEIDDLTEYFNELDNDADVDSAGPYDESPGRYEAVRSASTDRKTKTVSVADNRFDKGGQRTNNSRYESVQSRNSTNYVQTRRKEKGHSNSKQTPTARRVWENV